MKVVWSPLAIERAAEQAEYISQDKPDAARRWLAGLFAAAGKLSKFPRTGRVVPEIGRPEIREVAFGGCRIVYHLGPGQVAILTVRHARRLLDKGEVDVGSGP